MGDRALVLFHDGMGELSPVIYLHWGGWRVGKLLRKALPVLRKNDARYSAARFCGVCHSHSGKPDCNTGLGLFNGPETLKEAKERDFSHGDAGVFLVDTETGHVECFNGYGFGSDDEGKEPKEMTMELGELPK